MAEGILYEGKSLDKVKAKCEECTDSEVKCEECIDSGDKADLFTVFGKLLALVSCYN